MPLQTSYEKAVRLSVKCVYSDKTFSLVFWEEAVVGGNHFYLNLWVKLTLLERNRRFSVDIRS